MNAPASSDTAKAQIDPSPPKRDDVAVAASPGDDTGGGNRSESPVSDCNISEAILSLT